MRNALLEAEKAFNNEEVPVGSIIVYEDKIIARAHNQREMLSDPTAHAEMIAITQAASYLENWRLTGVTIYITLEPCLMCLGAIFEARIDTIVFGASDTKERGCTALDIVGKSEINRKLNIIPNILEQECKSILQGFFRDKRPNPDRQYQSENLQLKVDYLKEYQTIAGA